jgi:hypothetical protein
MPPYTQQRPLRVTPWPTRHTLACLEGEIEVYPELENSPRCGVYSKSATATGWQMIEAAVLGSHGITINHFDNMGNGIALDRHLAPHLAALRPQLNALAALRLDDREADGVQVLFSPKIAAALRLPDGEAPVATAEDFLALNRSLQAMGGGAGSGIRGSMQALVHSSMIWSEVCGILGIAHRLSSRVEPQRGPILVSGQTLEAFFRCGNYQPAERLRRSRCGGGGGLAASWLRRPARHPLRNRAVAGGDSLQLRTNSGRRRRSQWGGQSPHLRAALRR